MTIRERNCPYSIQRKDAAVVCSRVSFYQSLAMFSRGYGHGLRGRHGCRRDQTGDDLLCPGGGNHPGRGRAHRS
jgi:hypothetical protein